MDKEIEEINAKELNEIYQMLIDGAYKDENKNNYVIPLLYVKAAFERLGVEVEE